MMPFSIRLKWIIGLFFLLILLALYTWLIALKPAETVGGLLVPEGFEVREVVKAGLVTYPMFAVYDDTGKLYVFESSGHTEGTQEIMDEPTFQILLLSDSNGDGVFDAGTVYADKLPFPMGGTFFDGSLYVTAAPDLLKFTDTNGDGAADQREVLISGWKLNHNAAILSGPFQGPDGWLYMADARRGFEITTKEGGHLEGEGARIWRCLTDGSLLESFAGGGFDNAVELVFSPSGEVFGTMTYFVDPQGGYRDALMHWVEGGVYPKPNPVIEADKLVLTGELMPVMTKMARVSPSGLMRMDGEQWGSDFDGNFFHAQFNTGRIVRSKLIGDGASFRTEDSWFLESTRSGFYPTDVLQAGDGGILVINTGGWFIAGCPLSRTAKPELQGSIYHIRKKGSDPPSDPFGNLIMWKQLSTSQKIEQLSHSSTFVRKRAVESILKEGLKAIVPLKEVLNQATDYQVRTQAVFLLYRLGEQEGLQAVIPALADPHPDVRAAAARVLGLAREKSAVQPLISALADAEPPVARQAATALGRIGDPEAVPGLLQLIGTGEDRMVNHAVIYTLIQLDSEPELRLALTDSNPNIQRAALIALDQKGKNLLSEESVRPFLASENRLLVETGHWVLTHHPEWTGLATEYFKHLFSREWAESQASLQEMLVVYGRIPSFQQDLAEILLQSQSNPERQQQLLELLKYAPVKDFPKSWKSALKTWMGSGGEKVESEVLDLIISRRLSGFEPELKGVVASGTSYLQALKALMALTFGGYVLSEEEVTEIIQKTRFLEDPHEIGLSLSLLQACDLSPAQQERIIEEVLPNMEVRYLVEWLNLFEGVEAVPVSLTLIQILKGMGTQLDKLPLAQMEKLLANLPEELHAEANQLMQQIRQLHMERLSQLMALEESLEKGDVARGREVFYKQAACASCHAVAGEGHTFGPDLTNIGEIRSAHDILEAIIYPSASFAREYETAVLETDRGPVTGIIKESDAAAYVVEVGPGVFRHLNRDQVIQVSPSNLSLMPAGWENQLSRQELSDLMAFLRSLPDGLGWMRE
jgi:putative membrane-bound dehydrogenase-like protein